MKIVSLLFLLNCFFPQIGFAVEYPYRVLYASDGDTLMLAGQGRKIKVRLIGIDTPEMHESEKLSDDATRSGQDQRTIRGLGRRAARFTRTLVQGLWVRLEYDEPRLDRHGRTLAYVYFAMEEREFADKTGLPLKSKKAKRREYFLNRTLIESGYALAYTRFPFRYEKEFVKLQREARDAQRGLWRPDSKQRKLQEVPANPIKSGVDTRAYHSHIVVAKALR